MLLDVMSLTFNIIWRDVQRKIVANNVDRSSLRAQWQNGPYKTLGTARNLKIAFLDVFVTFRGGCICL